MDSDLLLGVFGDAQPLIPTTILSNSPRRSLTSRNAEPDLNAVPSAFTSQTQFSNHSDPLNPNLPGAVISKIEDIFEAMTDCMLGEKEELTLQLKTRHKSRSKVGDAVEKNGKNKTNSDAISIEFPSKSPKEAWKFSMFLFCFLELSLHLLMTFSCAVEDTRTLP